MSGEYRAAIFSIIFMAAVVESNYSFSCTSVVCCFFCPCVCVCSHSNHKHSQIFKFVTLETETNTCHLLIYFMRANLAKLRCVLTSRFYLTALLIFLFFSSVKAEYLKDTLAFPLCRWYSRVSGDQASRETSPSMMSRWRKESVETHRPVSSTPLVSLLSELRALTIPLPDQVEI